MNTIAENARRSDSGDGSRAPSSSAVFAAPAASFTRTWCSTPSAVDLQRDARAALAEADQLPVRARPRREALRADVQRLEQVRLARAVLPDDEHDARLEVEVEDA